MIAGVDLDVLAEWMDGEGLGGGPVEDARLLTGGTQNILVRFRRAEREYVLRRPPIHKRTNSDETMRREARVLAALAGSDVPHPAFIAGCPDEGVLGAAFYLMEPVDGFNPTTALPPLHAGDPAVRHAMGLEMPDAIAALHRVDFLAAGLDGFGKPDGYLERQVDRWRSQLESYSELEGYPGPEIPGVDAVADWLDANRPEPSAPGVIHGDFHLANVLFDPTSHRMLAMVDWELSTLGDPLVDLGQLLATWPASDDDPGAMMLTVQPWGGFPAPEELVARYAQGSNRDLTAANWYEVLACYRLGIILEGTHARAFAGKAPKEVGDLLHGATLALFARARRRAGV
ncbi:MAG: phosphotransferase family protein [Actinobacteria bacterium]|nr:phosphotransferase family protein [Actinomycetota bacterium]